MADIATGSPQQDHQMPPQDRDFWIAVGLWGAALVTVLGCGLYAFIEQSYLYGVGFTGAGFAGLMYLTFHLKGRRLTPKVGAMAAMLAVTWGLIAYQIWYGSPKASGAAAEATVKIQKATLIDWLQRAQQERSQAIAERNAAQNGSAADRQTTATLQSQLQEAHLALNEATQQLEVSRQQAKQQINPNLAITIVNRLGLSDDIYLIPKTFVLTTATPDNAILAKQIEDILEQATALSRSRSHLIPTALPLYDRDLDAPRIKGSGERGITIHGRTAAGNILMQVFANCFSLHQTSDMPSAIRDYWQKIYPKTTADINEIVWIDIGPGPVWARNCQ
jgi:hypothetical protein